MFLIHLRMIWCVFAGSGKKALLDIIACRANNGSKKGYVLLNGVNMNRRLFRVSILGNYLDMHEISCGV
jgi:hypothetical protein